MLVHHMRDESGTLLYYDAMPVTVTVSPSWAPRSRLPDGPPVHIGERHNALRLPSPSDAELERVCDHVHGWHGIAYEGRPLRCTRRLVKAMCRVQPHFLAEIRRAIKIASSSGVLDYGR